MGRCRRGSSDRYHVSTISRTLSSATSPMAFHRACWKMGPMPNTIGLEEAMLGDAGWLVRWVVQVCTECLKVRSWHICTKDARHGKTLEEAASTFL